MAPSPWTANADGLHTGDCHGTQIDWNDSGLRPGRELAPAQVVGGTISGTITDSTGAAIANAAVLVHNDETGNERHLQTGPDGRYAAPSIPVGSYTITADATGFSQQRRTGIALSVGQSQSVNLTLPLTGVVQTVTVNDESPVVDLSTQQTAA